MPSRSQCWALMADRDDLVLTLDELLERPPWMAQAACRGQDTAQWFPERGQDVRPAQAICRACPVVAECRAYALAERHGIWGGASERERRRLRRRAA